MGGAELDPVDVRPRADADEGPRRADDRHRALDHEELTRSREAAQADRRTKEQELLADAADRDDDADACDTIADERDRAVSLTAFLTDRESFGPALLARRSAAVYRMHSKTDRTASAADRANLTEDQDAGK